MLLSSIASALKHGDTGEVRRLTLKAVENGFSSDQILYQALLPAMDEVGRKFKGSEVFIPEVLMASRAMHAGIRILRDKSFSRVEEKLPIRILIGTVAGDLHDIGKNLVIMFMNVKRFEVINLGIDVPAEEFVWSVRKYRPHVLAMSALLTTTMPAMEETINALKEAGLRDTVKILVGGGPVTQQYAVEIGADGYADDAKGAADWISDHFHL